MNITVLGKYRKQMVLVAGIAVLLATIAPAPKAFAWYCDGFYRGRDSCQGYFSGVHNVVPVTPGTVDDVILGGTSALGPHAFVTQIDNALTGSGSHSSVGAAFIIANMYGMDGTDFSSKANGQAWARAHFSEWEARIRAYDAAGFIDWSRTISTATAPNMGGGSGEYRNSAWFMDINDEAFHLKPDETITVIEIRTPSGGYFRLERKCLNLVGILSPVPDLSTDATIEARSLVNGTNNNSVVVDAAAGTTVFEHGIVTTNYGGKTHNVSYRIERSVNADMTCNAPYVAVAAGTVAITGNGYTSVWGPANVPWPRATTQRICQQLRITNRDDATLSGNNPANRWATIAGGNITMTVTPSGYVEQGVPIMMNGTITATGDFSLSYDIHYTTTIPGLIIPAPKNTTVVVAGAYNVDNLLNSMIPAGAPAGTEVCVIVSVSDPTLPRYFGGGANPSPLSSCLTVVNKPVFMVNGGDIVAGAAVDTSGSCGVGAISGVGGWNSGLAPAYQGANSQLAAFATGTITGFATAARNMVGTTAPTGLAFTNTTNVNIPLEQYGGGLERVPCIDNHWAMPAATPPNIGAGNIGKTGGGGGTGIFQLSSAITSPITVDVGVQQIIYVTGNLRINRNITYAGRGTWSGLRAIPALKFVVTGDIIIDNTVTDLDGIYVATGNIYTCDAAIDTGLYGNCGARLRVRGALVAQGKVNLMRTFGSISNAAPGNVAEEITYLPEVWMAQWPEVGGGDNDSGTYDSITALPPVL